VRRFPAHRIGSFVAVLAFGALFLAACSAIPFGKDEARESNDQRDPDVFEKIRSIDLLPRYPSQATQADTATGKRLPAAIYLGTNEPPLKRTSPGSTAGADGYDLNFENTPVASVAKVVLGDILGAGYIIDPRVQGTISLSSGRPIAKSDVVFVLENALRLSGVALVHDNTGYRLMPQGDATGAGGLDDADRAEPGYGISAVPLQYVSAPTLIKMIDSFATKPGMIRADPGRNLILIQGSGTERRNAIDLVLSFDADWMRGQSVGIFPIQNSNPEPIIAELEKIMASGEGGIAQGLVTLQPISRMNAVLAVSRKPELLRRVETWVHRLDNADTGRSSVHVYQLKYGEARQVARVLNDVFGNGGSSSASSGLDSSSDQIAPGSGLASSSSRLSAGTSPGSGGFGASQPGGGFGTSQPAGLGSGGLGSGGAAQTATATGGAQSGGSPYEGRGSSASGLGGGTSNTSTVLQGVRITADTVNNTLLIYGNQENYTIIARTLRQIDRPQLQVGIDTTVAEVTLNDNLNYGVQFFLSSRNLGLPADRGSVLNTQAGQAPAAAVAGAAAGAFINRAFPGFNFLVGPEVQPNMILDALHAVTDVKVLSNPSVVVIDNEVATLQVGDQVPVSTGSATVLSANNTVVSTIDYRNTGIILRVVPRVNANGNVRLEIEQEISNVSPQSVSTLTPTVTQRKVRSSVAVASGQTVLLGGLISETDTGSRSGVPLLDQIPGLGAAFSSTGKGVQRTELIILIRPQIIRDGVDAHFVAEELRTKLRGTIGAVRSTPDAKYR
jgi:general secretion pathway protein D